MRGELVKLAWKRDPTVPPGRPAPGHLDCPCGGFVRVPVFGQGTHTCGWCGRSYDGHGWLVDYHECGGGCGTRLYDDSAFCTPCGEEANALWELEHRFDKEDAQP